MKYLVLLALFEIKHFFADWVFQTNWMVQGKRMPWLPLVNWVEPLGAHSAIHGLLTITLMLGVSLFYADITPLLWLGLMDFGTHFVMDRVKGAPNFLGQYAYPTKMFWISMGIDQAVHHMMNFYAVYKIANLVK